MGRQHGRGGRTGPRGTDVTRRSPRTDSASAGVTSALAERKHATIAIPSRRGFALSDAITGPEVARAIGGGDIFLVQCMKYVRDREKEADRVVVLTDEQDCDTKLKPEAADAFGEPNYLINVASAKNGIGYRKWVHIDRWSDKVLTYIAQAEANGQG